MALAPIMGFFLLFQIITKKFRKRQLVQMMMGMVYTFVGLVLFLTGVNVGVCLLVNIWEKRWQVFRLTGSSFQSE